MIIITYTRLQVIIKKKLPSSTNLSKCSRSKFIKINHSKDDDSVFHLKVLRLDTGTNFADNSSRTSIFRSFLNGKPKDILQPEYHFNSKRIVIFVQAYCNEKLEITKCVRKLMPVPANT